MICGKHACSIAGFIRIMRSLECGDSPAAYMLQSRKNAGDPEDVLHYGVIMSDSWLWLTALRETQSYKCSDPRDKIYAIRCLPWLYNGWTNIRLQPNYDLSCCELVLAFVAYCDRLEAYAEQKYGGRLKDDVNNDHSLIPDRTVPSVFVPEMMKVLTTSLCLPLKLEDFWRSVSEGRRWKLNNETCQLVNVGSRIKIDLSRPLIRELMASCPEGLIPLEHPSSAQQLQEPLVNTASQSPEYEPETPAADEYCAPSSSSQQHNGADHSVLLDNDHDLDLSDDETFAIAMMDTMAGTHRIGKGVMS